MSTQTEPPESEAQTDDERLVEKEVTITAYAPLNVYGSEREFASDLDPGSGSRYYEKKTRTKQSNRIKLGEHFNEDLYKYDFQDLVAELNREGANIEVDEDGNLVDFDFEAQLFVFVDGEPTLLDVPLSIEFEREETEDYEVTSPGYTALCNVQEHLKKELFPEELPGGLVLKDYGTNWQDPDREETLVRVRRRGVEERTLLTHHSERSADNRIEDDRERLSAQFQVDMGPAPQTLIDQWTEQVVSSLTTWLGRHNAIEKVRISSCRVTKEGDCYGI